MKLKSIASKSIDKCLGFHPKKNTIVFESNPDFACNTYPVFIELLNEQKLRKWKFVWVCKDYKKSHKQFPNIKYIEKTPKSVFSMLKKEYCLNTSKCLISCNGLLGKHRPNQLAVFLSHGSKTKKTKNICEIGNAVDYVSCQSHFFDEVICYEYNLIKDQLIYFGYPRTDVFFREGLKSLSCLGIPENAKFFIWLPTFRKSLTANRNDSDSKYAEIGMPLVYDLEMLSKLNSFLADNELYIVYKPHPAQDISGLRATTLSNIIVINDDILSENDLQLYEVIASSSALITDYSSVFYDYLLLNRPIATTTDDIEEWKKNRGFAFDLENLYDRATVRVGSSEELSDFLLSVKYGKDDKKDARAEIRDMTNCHKDGNSAERVSRFIIEQLQLRKLL